MKFVNRIPIVLAALVALSAPAVHLLANETAAPQLDPEEKKKVLYAFGVAVAQNLVQFELTEEELGPVLEGISDTALQKESRVDMMVYGPMLQQFAKARAQEVLAAKKAKGEEYLAKAAAAEGAKRTDSGLVYQELTPGSGASPAATDTVTVHYTGTLTDGTVFDTSVGGEPRSFQLNGVVGCWTEGVQMMKIGGKAKLVCPSDIAYGDRGRPPQIPGGAVLVFEIELVDVQDAAADEGG